MVIAPPPHAVGANGGHICISIIGRECPSLVQTPPPEGSRLEMGVEPN